MKERAAGAARIDGWGGAKTGWIKKKDQHIEFDAAAGDDAG